MSIGPYQQYKDSDVTWLGAIPSHWQVLKSRRLFSERKERARLSDEQLTASQKYGVIYQKDFMALENQRVMQVIHGAEILKHVEPNDFVISMRSFQGGIEWCGLRGSTSSAYIILVPSEEVAPSFFRYLLKSSVYIQALQSTTNLVRDGQALRFENFTLIDLPLPPASEQQAITDFLDRETAKIDALGAEQKRLIDLLKEKRQAVISHVVTKGLDPNVAMKDSGAQWLGEVPTHWEVGALRRFVNSVQTGRTPKAELPSEDVSGGWPWFTPGDFGGEMRLKSAAKFVSRDAVESGDASYFPVGAVLIVSIGATLGKVGLPDRPSSANQQINAVVPFDRLNSQFLAYSLTAKAEVMRYLSNASTIGIMNQEKTKEITIALPSLAEQLILVAHLDRSVWQIDRLVGEAKAAIALLKERRAALISAAVTGKIDVRGLAEGDALIPDVAAA